MGTRKNTARKKFKVVAPLIVLCILVLALAWYLRGANVQLLAPRGTVSERERELIFVAFALSLIVVLPVFVLLFVIAWKYREGNKKAVYRPNMDRSRALETMWWTIPSILILILSVITWRTSHSLDPYKPIASTQKPLIIQVVSLDWKWLFIYPDQQVASVNTVHIPLDRPVEFEITSDSVMNSFWIPQLGGQVYSMPGMSTQLHLMAAKAGIYRGSSANISGSGFSGMTFGAHAERSVDFNAWIIVARHARKPLTTDAYAALARPSKNMPITLYSAVERSLYDTIVMKYMTPGADTARASAEGMQ